MSSAKQADKIQVDEDLAFTRREWRWQRIGWVAMAGVIAAAALGAFGHGPVARQRVGDPKVFAIEFDRIVRHSSTSNVILHVGPGLQTDSILRIAISRDYLSNQKTEAAWPEPLDQSASGEFVVFEFQRNDPGFPMQIVLQLRSNSYGAVNGKVQLVGLADLDINQFVLP